MRPELTEVVATWTARVSATATTHWAFFAWTCFVCNESATCEFSTMHGFDSFTSFVIIWHFNETKTA